MKLFLCLLCFCCLAWQVQSKEVPLKVVTEPLPPFQIVENGHVVGGLSTEIVQALLQHTGENARISSHNWARTYKIAKEQPNVMIFSLGRNARREGDFKWVGLIYNLENYFWKLKSRDDIIINDIQQAKLYRTAVARENVEHQLLLQRGFIEPHNLIVTSSIDHALGMVLRERADLYVGSKPLIVYILKGSRYQYADLEPIYRVKNDSVKLSIAFSLKTDDAKVELYQQAFAEIKRNGTYERIINKWENLEYLE